MIVITSLAPQFSRTDKTGCEIGEEYRAACIDSWRKVSEQIFTINAVGEDIKVPGVQRLLVENSALEETGRPLPYLQSMIGAALSCNDDRFLIVNGDIRLVSVDVFSQARPGTAIVSKRHDVDEIGATGKIHTPGYDAFAVHRDDLSKIFCGGIFGAPWYDYYLPIRLIESGVEVKVVHAVEHLKHKQNWSWDLWEQLGWDYAKTVPRFLPRLWRLRRLWRGPKGSRVLHEVSRRTYLHIDSTRLGY